MLDHLAGSSEPPSPHTFGRHGSHDGGIFQDLQFEAVRTLVACLEPVLYRICRMAVVLLDYQEATPSGQEARRGDGGAGIMPLPPSYTVSLLLLESRGDGQDERDARGGVRKPVFLTWPTPRHNDGDTRQQRDTNVALPVFTQVAERRHHSATSETAAARPTTIEEHRVRQPRRRPDTT